MKETMEEKTKKVTLEILEVIWPKGFDIDAKLFENVQEIISIAIQKERERIIEEVEKMKVTLPDHRCLAPKFDCTYGYTEGMNDRLNQVISLLKQVNKEL